MIEAFKRFYIKNFHMKNLQSPKYFLGENDSGTRKISLSIKYTLDIIHETCLLGTKATKTPVDKNKD